MAFFQCAACDDIVPCDYDLDNRGRRVYNLRQRVCDTCRYGPRTPEPKRQCIRRRIIREADAEDDAIWRAAWGRGEDPRIFLTDMEVTDLLCKE